MKRFYLGSYIAHFNQGPRYDSETHLEIDKADCQAL